MGAKYPGILSIGHSRKRLTTNKIEQESLLAHDLQGRWMNDRRVLLDMEDAGKIET